MGLADQFLEAAGSGAHAGLIGSVVDMLVCGQGAGLQGLVKAFGENGLGDIVGSWVGKSTSLPISAQQIQQALGSEMLQQLATQHGLEVRAVASQLAQHLPGIVDRLTPNGIVPAPGALHALLKGMLG
jgi:uncharacterized protein YidB (DUF937 family)